jgi:hypothetical protein
VERTRGSSGGRKPTRSTISALASRAVAPKDCVNAATSGLYPLSRIAARISSRALLQPSVLAGRRNSSASRIARSSATQHINFEYTKWRGAPRISQMLRSGRLQFAAASSAR